MLNKFTAMVLAITLVFSFATNAVSVSAAETKTVTILTTSDIHGMVFPWDYPRGIETNSGSLARISTVVRAQRKIAPNLILIDTGDTLESNMAYVFNSAPVHPIVTMMNDIGYDIWTLGNHEFNFGRDFINRNTAAFKATVLAGNLITKDKKPLYNMYDIIERDGLRIAVVGLTQPNIKLWNPGHGKEYADFDCVAPIEVIDGILAQLEGKYDVLVGAFHLGFYTEGGPYADAIDDIVKKYPQFNLINSGHTHVTADSQLIIKNGNQPNDTGVLVTAPSGNGDFLTKSEIKLEKQGSKWVVVSVMAENISTKGLEPDPEFIQKYQDYHKAVLAYADTDIGTVTKDFIDRVDYATGSQTKVTTVPTAQLFDNAVIDFINEVQMFYAKSDIASAALFDQWSNLSAGELKRKNLSAIYKYNNSIEGYNISGENLHKYMEWSANYYNTIKPGHLTVSFNPKVRSYYYDMFDGCEYTIDLTKEAGQRVTLATVGGKPFDPTATYKIAVNDFRGAQIRELGFVTLDDRYFETLVSYPDTSDIRLMIEKYVTEELGGVITPKVNNNWKLVGFDFNDPMVKKTYELLGKGNISIPKSEDGRDLNVSSITLPQVQQFLTQTAEYSMPVATAEPYVVVPGDTLWDIARRFYGSPRKWSVIYEANKAKVSNPRLIYAGMELAVPSMK